MQENRLLVFFRLIRFYQWSKNILIFLPLFLAHKFFEINNLNVLVQGFFAFSLCASSLYIANDLIDINNDKTDVLKRNRPITSKKISFFSAKLIMAALAFSGFVLALLINEKVFFYILFYLILGLIYTFFLKKILFLDIIALSFFFTFRILFGAEIINISVSFWLLVFSIFFFFSFAVLKRYSELVMNLKKEHVSGRSYTKNDLPLLKIIGISSGYLSVIIFALYINSANVKELYPKYYYLILVIPILLYWISYYWFKVSRMQIKCDPIYFMIRDRVSYIIIFLFIAVFYLASGLVQW